MNNRSYDILKYFAQITLPALGTLYFALSQIWGLPFGEEIVGTIVALDVFLGALLKLSSNKYYASSDRYDGVIDIYEDEETKRFVLNVDGDPYQLEHKEQLVFKVETPDEN